MTSSPVRQPALWSIGVAAPPLVSQACSAGLGEARSCETDQQRSFLRRVYSRSNVITRGSVLQASDDPDEVDSLQAFYPQPTCSADRGPTTAARMRRYAIDAPALAQRAGATALAQAGVAPSRVTHLVSVSCTGFCAPGMDVELIHRLGLPATVSRVHVGFMGCHAALNALSVARSIALANREAVILVCSVELCSLHFAYGWSPDRVVANSLFADGAAASVVAADPPTAAAVPMWRLDGGASLLVPDTLGAMTWRIGDHGYEMTLAPQVPGMIGHHLRAWCNEWLGAHDTRLADVALWAAHPGGPKILDAVEDTLQLPPDALRWSRDVLARLGNMSSATVLFILRQMALDGARGRCVTMGFGPGLTMEGLLLHR